MSLNYENPMCKNGKLEYKNKKCRCKIKNPKTIKIKKLKKPIKIKKSIKKTKCSVEKQNICITKNKICNPETGRCKNPPKNKSTLKSIIPIDSIIENYKPRSPSYSPTRDDYMTTSPIQSITSYSPSLNKKLLSLKTITPKSYIHNCPGSDVVIQTKKTRKCMKWTGSKAKKAMLDNLLSKTPIVCEQIIAPKQYQSNCWMNAFFMAWFISDKGRKFNRWFRETMIRGIMPNGKAVSKKLKKPLWLLNKMIDASIRGFSGDGKRYADIMDTNEVIRSIHKAVSSNNTKIVKTKSASNPLTFYRELYNIISGDFMPWGQINIHTKRGLKTAIKSQLQEWKSQNTFPKVIFLIFYDDMSDQNKPQKIKFDNKIFKLDAVIIRNTKRHHFSACIICNKKEFGFDGESYSGMQPFKWSEKLNKNEEWKFQSPYETYFNFKQGYQILMYYRS